MKTKESVLSAQCLVLSAKKVLVTVALCAVGFAAFADGSGTPNDPWLIGSPNAADVIAYTSQPSSDRNKLYVRGIGAMKDFPEGAPWASPGNPIDEMQIVSGPDSRVTTIGASAFAGCAQLSEVRFPKFASVTAIGASAFAGCTNLYSFTIQDTVTTIGASAFAGCPLYSVEIPASVTTIGEGAFKDCDNLTTVTVRAVVPPSLGKDAISTVGLQTIYVPEAGLAAYRQADGWKKYASYFKPVYALTVWRKEVVKRISSTDYDPITSSIVTNWVDQIMVVPAESGYSWSTDADGKPLLTITEPDMIVRGTTTREHILLDAESVTLDDLTMDVTTNCVVTYRTDPTTVIIGYPKKNASRRGKVVESVKLRASGARNACIIASNGGSLVIKNNGKLFASADGDVAAIWADGDISIDKPGRLDCRAEQAAAIGTKGKLTITSMSAEVVLRGFKSGVCGALEAAEAIVLPATKGWGVYGSTDMAAPVTNLFERVTVGKPSGSGVCTGCIGGDFAKVVTFARLAEVKDSTDLLDWGVESVSFRSAATPHGKFLEGSADEMIAAYSARIAKDPTDYEAFICRAFAYMKKAGENQTFFDLAKDFGYVFDNDTMHFTGELVHERGVTPEMNESTAEVCDILLPLMNAAYADLIAIPYNWKGSVRFAPDFIIPVDDEVYFDYADVLMAKAGLAEAMCVLNMVKGFDVTMDSDKLPDTFNSINRSNGKRGVQAILENNPEFFSKVRDQKALTEAAGWWASAATLLDQWDKARVKRSDGKPHFFDWNFEKLDSNGTYGVDWLRRQSQELANLPYWASPIDFTKINGDDEQFLSFKPIFEGKFLRKDFPEFGVGVKAPWCNEPIIDTLPDSTLCGILPSVSPTYFATYISTRWTDIPPYTDNRTAPVYGIWYKNQFTEGGIGFENEGNPLWFAWDNANPIKLLDPEFNVRGVTAIFRGWSGAIHDGNTPITFEESEIPTPIGEPMKYVWRRVELTANFEIPTVTYLDFDETSGKLVERTAECEIVTEKTTTLTTGKVYVVVGNVSLANRVKVLSTTESPAKLVLCDEAKLTATKGVEVAAGNALTLCGQALGTGTLEATGSEGAAGIGGGGTVTINGGTVMATGGSSAVGIGGTVTINGGTVTAAGSDDAAGIAGTVKFADGTAYGVAAGADEADALYMTAAAYAADHSAAYVALPYFSLKIPEAKAGYTYEVSSMGAQPKAVLADQTNTYAIAAGATARVFFTLEEDYVFDGPFENPMIIAKLSGDTVVDAADLPTVKFAKKGSAENPWTVGRTTLDSVTAWTNGTDKLVVEGAGNMDDFTEGNPAPWGTGITEVEIGEDVTGIGANAFADSQLGSVTIPASVTSIGAAAFSCSTSLSNVVVEAMTPPALGAGAFEELAEGYKIIVPQGTGAAYKAAPGWSDYADSIFEQGSPECPWEIGKTAGDSVIAYLDGDGKLVIEGEGDMKDFDPSSDPAPWGTGITEVEIGEDVTGIGANAFAGSTSLSSVTVEAMTPPTLGADAFAGTAEDLKIAVPFGTGEAYKAAPDWGDYADSIVEQGTPECPWTVGTGVTAYIDENGTLHVEGEGNMKDFTAADPAPWGASSADIKSIEIGEGVTKVGNCAFIDCSIDAPNTFTVDDEDFELNLLAFVSADGSATNAPATEVFRVVKSETGMAEPAVAFGPKDSTDFSRSVEIALRFLGTAPVQVLTLADIVNRDKAAFTLLAGEKPYSKAMQGLLDEAFEVLDGAESDDDIVAIENEYVGKIATQAGKDKSHEIEDTDITWRALDDALVISGEGEMPDFVDPDFPSGAPWGTDITSVKIGEDVTGIGAKAFTDSQLGSATIPETVTNIGASAFADCTSLSNMVVEAMTPPALGADALSGCTAIETIYVPYGTGEDYKAAPGWSDFADRIVELPQPIVAESDEFTVDLRSSVELAERETTVSNITWSATLWGELDEEFVTAIGWTNLTTGATGVFSNLAGVVGDAAEDANLPKKDGEYVLTHSTGDLKSFVTFVVSGYPLGSEGNPWLVGPADDPESTVAWTDGDGTVYFKPPRSSVSREGLATIINAMGGTGFDMALVAADGTATNDVVALVGDDGMSYDTLADVFAADPMPTTVRLYEVPGQTISLPAGIAGEAFVVSNLTTGAEITPSSTLPGGAEYVLPFGAKVAIYVVPSDGYRLLDDGTNPIVIDEVTTETTVDVSEIPTVKSLAEESAIGDSDVTWKIEDGVLVIDGSGDMPDFDEANPAPWNEFSDKITAVSVGEGVEHLGDAAFFACPGATSITLANEEGIVNLAAFVSPDGTKNFPASVYVVEDGTSEQAVRFEGDADDYDSLDAAYAAGETDVAPLTLNNVKAGYVEGLEEIAGPAPRSEEMQQLLNEAIDAVLAATTAAEVDAAAEDKGFPVSVLSAKEAVEKAAGDPAKRSKELQAAVDEALAAIDAAKTFEEVASVRAEALAAINELVGKLGELYPNGDGGVFVTPVKATAYEGVVLDASGAVSGTINVKLSKPSKKGVMKVTAKVKTFVDKKTYSFKLKDVSANVNGPLVVSLDPSNKKSAGHALAIAVEGDSLTGAFDEGSIDAACNVFKRKGDPKRDAVKPIAGVWTGAFTCDAGEIYFSAKLRKSGSASVKVVLPNGKKASVSSKIEVGDNVVAVPVTVSKVVKGVTMTFGFRLAFVAGGDANTINVTPLETRDRSKTVLSSDVAELLAVGMQKVTSKEFKTYQVAVDPALEAALGPITKNNLRLASASGWISGSLKFGKVSGNASGVVVNGAGIGKVSVKINRVKYDYQFVVAP